MKPHLLSTSCKPIKKRNIFFVNYFKKLSSSGVINTTVWFDGEISTMCAWLSKPSTSGLIYFIVNFTVSSSVKWLTLPSIDTCNVGTLSDLF